MAELFFRQGFALAAMGQYESAARDFRHGLRLQAEWQPDDLRLDRLYGPDVIAKHAHFEAMAQSIQTSPHNPNLLFVLGVELYFDGQPARASAFLQRAAQLGGNADHLLDGLLNQPDKPARVKPLPGKPADGAKPAAAVQAVDS